MVAFVKTGGIDDDVLAKCRYSLRSYVGPKEGRHTVEEYLAGDDWSELCESPMRNDERTDDD